MENKIVAEADLGIKERCFVSSLLETLSECIVYERAQLILYTALFDKARSLRRGKMLLDELSFIRDQKLDHFQLFTEFAAQMGSPASVESCGMHAFHAVSRNVLEIVRHPYSALAQSFSVLLSSELTGNFYLCWQRLIQLAENAGLEELTGPFEQALQSEMQHNEIIRQRLTEEVFDEAA
ncbi:MAG: hypothetical protein HY586_03420 [Candidatus Omnitrophica bacterium]|nr:hypothetical protein [Candidatus Omnitrophota bacterium]